MLFMGMSLIQSVKNHLWLASRNWQQGKWIAFPFIQVPGYDVRSAYIFIFNIWCFLYVLFATEIWRLSYFGSHFTQHYNLFFFGSGLLSELEKQEADWYQQWDPCPASFPLLPLWLSALLRCPAEVPEGENQTESPQRLDSRFLKLTLGLCLLLSVRQGERN